MVRERNVYSVFGAKLHVSLETELTSEPVIVVPVLVPTLLPIETEYWWGCEQYVVEVKAFPMS
jgi:hypothetical protein